MKRLLSMLITSVMIISCCAFSLPSDAAADNIEITKALYFASAPTIDGYISEAEWGTATFTVTANDAASVDDSEPYTRFLYWEKGNKMDYAALSYQVWLRWDENYFYIGAKVNDPDGHSLKNGMSELWNGDALQTRIDEEGPNAASGGEKFVVTSNVKTPWSSASVPDFVFGYTEICGGFTEAWENSELHGNYAASGVGLTEYSNPVHGAVKCAVAPAGMNYSSDSARGITTYEVAIPWTYIFVRERGNETPKNLTTLTYEKYLGNRQSKNEGIGRVFGMSLVVLDAPKNSSSYSAFLTWGSGICHTQWDMAPQTCTGSNSVTLSATQVTPAVGHATYDPEALLNAKFDTSNIDADERIYYDYLGGDTERRTPSLSEESLMTLTYDNYVGDLEYWGGNAPSGSIMDVGGTHGNVLFYPDGVVQTYICTSNNEVDFTYPLSYTLQFDIRYTGTDIMLGAEGYGSAVYNWFGGRNGYGYECGYFFDDNSFEIRETATNKVIFKGNSDVRLQKDNWYRWRFQFDNSACLCRLWIDDLTYDYDNNPRLSEGATAWGTNIFNVSSRYFYYSDMNMLRNGTMMMFRQLNTQVQYDNVKIYNFASQGYQRLYSTDLSRILPDYKEVSDLEAMRFWASMPQELALKLSDIGYVAEGGVTLRYTVSDSEFCGSDFYQYYLSHTEAFGTYGDGIISTSGYPAQYMEQPTESDLYGTRGGFSVYLTLDEWLVDYVRSLSDVDRMMYLGKVYLTLLSNSHASGVACYTRYPEPQSSMKVDTTAGDVNNDGFVNSRDSLLVCAYNSMADGFRMNVLCADMNGDREINAKDSLLLKRKIVNSI